MAQVIADKYEVQGVLGEGGTGIVYDAIRVEDKAPVALKVMHASLAGDKQIRGRFQREAAILRRLEGPHICPILDHGEVPGEEEGTTVIYLALPKIEGQSLAEILATEGPMTVERALDIMLEVLSALKSAHAQGVIHRDLKPANVILKGGLQVVVVDFGMSKIITGAGTGTTNLTTHNMVFGTPEYMSPEQARGDELDARCDVYAAGVMLYEMLTGSPPFTGATPLNVLTAHLTSDLEPPSKRAPDGKVTPALESVIVNALQRDRDQRYPSAAAFAAAILHARAAPDDVVSLRPAAFSHAPPGTDPLAATMPAIGVPPPDPSAPKAIVNDDRKVTTAPPPAAEPRSRKDSRSSGPISAPTSRKTKIQKESNRPWVIAWVLVGIVSIAAGVYFALK